MSGIDEHTPIWVWQTLDPRDGAWGTMQVYLASPASLITGDGEGHNLVLQARSIKVAESMRPAAEQHHRMTGQPVRLVKFHPDSVVEIL